MTNKSEKSAKCEVPVYCAYKKIEHIEKLIPNPKNPNVHPNSQIELLAKIIRIQGWRNPIVVSKRSGFVIKGHGRLMAAQINGYNWVPIDLQEYENEATEYADMVADNKIAELSVVNMEMVMEELGQIGDEIDLDIVGIPNLNIEMPEVSEPEPKMDDDQWILTVQCKNEKELANLHKEMTDRGFECKLIT